MSLWWAKREQLDRYQVSLIENLPLQQNHLILGPPGSGKSNVLLRRAQFVRGQEMPNVLVITFTRPLAEFVKTGCFDAQGREIFPRSCVTTLESWLRWLYARHRHDRPDERADLQEWKKELAAGALVLREGTHLPEYDALFVDEAQDLLPEEIEVLKQWTPVLFFAGDDRQRIYANADGLEAVRQGVPGLQEHLLPFHYRLAPQICRMADRILVPEGGGSLESTSHYEGPRPGWIGSNGPLTETQQLERAAAKLREQIRFYADLIRQGDRLGVVVARREHRDTVFEYFEGDPALQGRSKIIRAKAGNEDAYDPSFEPDVPICILTVQGCKGLEFRAVHWLFCEELSYHHNHEHYYTVVTRAKTGLDLYYSSGLPQALARAYAPAGEDLW
jgi:superfamily I DNA/RNA helicase